MTSTLQAVLDRAVEQGKVAGITAAAVNRDDTIFAGAAGRARVADGVEMRVDSIFQIFSMTKAIASLAAMQLVEQGALDLDAPGGRLLPALAGPNVLGEDGSLRPATRPVTLRQLLTHTSGFGYAGTSDRLARFLAERGPGSDVDTPLLFEPGERWLYGVSTDWAGRMVEAASGITLDAYLDGHILRPLGMRDTTYALSDDQVARHVSMHRRRDDGGLDERPFTAPQPRVGGGSGLASTARDYARFLRFMLTDGALDGTRLLSLASMATFTANHTAEIVAGEWKTAAPETSNDVAFSDGGTARHSLGFLRAGRDVPGARAQGSLSWAGIANTYFWIDRRTGVAGTVFMQVMPFADPTCLGVLDEFERTLYATVRA